ncbi:MAG: hypothetical protein ACRD4C_13250 [Candidatus Acidiferrales bacterium]
MGTEFRDARLKIKRAKKHIEDIQSAILALENSCISTIEHRPNGGESLKHEIPDFQKGLDELSLIVGDAFHNLRTALDFAWYSTVSRLLPDKVSDSTKFPVRKTRQEVEAALHGIEVDARCKPLFDCIVSQIQPYAGSANSVLWTLHDIDISDKHLLLLGLDHRGMIGGISVRDENRELHRGASIPARGMDGQYVIPFVVGLKVEEKGKLTVTVTLEEAGIFKPLPVLTLLHDFRNFTFDAVKLLENVCC